MRYRYRAHRTAHRDVPGDRVHARRARTRRWPRVADAAVGGEGSGREGTRHRHDGSEALRGHGAGWRAPLDRRARRRDPPRRRLHHRMGAHVNKDEILKTVERLVLEVAGDELLLAGPFTMETSFNADLELESI